MANVFNFSDEELRDHREKTAEFVANKVADEMPLERHNQFMEMVKRVRQTLVDIGMNIPPFEPGVLALARDACRKVRDERLGPYLKTAKPDCNKWGHTWLNDRCEFCGITREEADKGEAK